MALFELTKTNVATRDLTSPDPQALHADGEARSLGIELDASGQLTSTVSVIASYAYTDARFTQDDGGLQGHGIANVPRHAGSLWAKVQMVPERLFVMGGQDGKDGQNPAFGLLNQLLSLLVSEKAGLGIEEIKPVKEPSKEKSA